MLVRFSIAPTLGRLRSLVVLEVLLSVVLVLAVESASFQLAEFLVVL
jgi:hypothetical protein